MSNQTKEQKKQAFKKLVKTIEKSNDKFAKATPAQRIVMVSRDILSLLDLGRIKPRTGNYVSMDSGPTNKIFQAGEQVSDLLKMPDLPACSVCAIGAAMVLSTLRLNDVQVDVNRSWIQPWYVDDDCFSNDNAVEDGMSERARSVFPDYLLRAMEEAFECQAYGYYMKTDTARLRAIYQNLIDNKGEKFTAYKSEKIVWSL